MPDWQQFVWVCVGVLLSAVLPFAVTALWPSPQNGQRGLNEDAGAIFHRIWPGLRLLFASLVVGAVVLVAAKAAGQEIAVWWQAVLVGLAADRGVQVVRQIIARRYA